MTDCVVNKTGPGYTVLNNSKAALISSADAFAVWAYLASVPDGATADPHEIRARYRVRGKPMSAERYRKAIDELLTLGLVG